MRLISTSLMVLFLAGSTASWAGSLWREAVTDEKGMFSDKVARRVGDIVTIVIDETATSTNSVVTTTNKTSTGPTGLASNLVGQFVAGANEKLKGTNNPLSKFPLNLLPRPNSGVVLPTPSGTSPDSSVFKGGGDISNSQKMTAQMAVQVIDRLPNGNLVIEGIRQIGFTKERQFASLRGIIRPYDISTTNTVASSAVADARIDVVTEGALSTAQKKGWLLKFDEKISSY